MGDDMTLYVYGGKKRQRQKVMHFVQHPEFSKETFQNDIAVIRVGFYFNVLNKLYFFKLIVIIVLAFLWKEPFKPIARQRKFSSKHN